MNFVALVLRILKLLHIWMDSLVGSRQSDFDGFQQSISKIISFHFHHLSHMSPEKVCFMWLSLSSLPTINHSRALMVVMFSEENNSKIKIDHAAFVSKENGETLSKYVGLGHINVKVLLVPRLNKPEWWIFIVSFLIVVAALAACLFLLRQLYFLKLL
ncbi:hypothetical protein Bca101_066650 [Brassica carinata]